jgi:hypothetical protein
VSSLNVDISTTTLPVTAVKRGDFNIADYKMAVFNKASGVGTAIRRGYACSQNNAVTPNVFAVTAGKIGTQVVISAMPFAFIPAYLNVTNDPTGNGEDITSGDTEISFQGILEGRVVVKCSGTLQPGDQVMTAAAGAFIKYDGSGAQFIKGTYLGLPGGVTDGAYIKQGATDGQLVVIDFEGGN